MLSDIEIAQSAKLKRIDDLAHEWGLEDNEFEPYGWDKAKLTLNPERKADAKLILVTATSGMPAGSGKTTTSIALAQALNRLGKKAVLALREPSLGPVFGMKGGAAGGGYSQVLPMESVNLHFTGDFHAITAANNLISALIDNARHQRQIDLKEVTWRRVLDVNDRQLRNIVTGLGGSANGTPSEAGFDITAASELMAVLCLATDLDDLRPVSGDLYLWQGDITRLKCGAIVNAANSGMTGCYIPCHACIDNCIHTFAGVQLRQDCAALMAEQGHEEPTGQAKITKAYNLPCDYVLHTVGPIVSGRVTREDERLLASCYRSCLELAEKNSVRSIAFCCISTGVFHFPNERAAEIAVETVRRYKVETGSKIKVVFNVFKDLDKTIYERLLGANCAPAARA